MFVRIRPAHDSDLPLLVELNRHVHEMHLQLEPELYRTVDPATLVDSFTKRLADPEWEIRLAEVDGDCVGYICWTRRCREETPFTHTTDTLYVDQIEVVPPARRCGVGRKLMDAAELRARELDCADVTLHVQGGNEVARAFYKGLDYNTISVKLKRSV